MKRLLSRLRHACKAQIAAARPQLPLTVGDLRRGLVLGHDIGLQGEGDQQEAGGRRVSAARGDSGGRGPLQRARCAPPLAIGCPPRLGCA